MLKKKFISLLLTLLFIPAVAHAKLTVLTSTTDIASIVREIGKDDVNVESIAKGTQDPHAIEAKPSFMVKASRADLLAIVGLELEIGWIPPIVQGARNPKIHPGSAGYFEVGPLVSRLEVPSTSNLTRSAGDVHPDGNPHIFLDPIRAGEVAVKIAEKMGKLDSAHAAAFKERAMAMQKRWTEKVKSWQARIEKTKIKKIVAYHKTLTYFLDRFKIQNPIELEPKPGIPPTAPHIAEVIETIKSQKIPLVMVENYYDPTPLKRLKEAVPTLQTAVVPVAVEGADGVKTLDDLYEYLVQVLEGKHHE